jgi:hypothetical protein
MSDVWLALMIAQQLDAMSYKSNLFVVFAAAFDYNAVSVCCN